MEVFTLHASSIKGFASRRASCLNEASVLVNKHFKKKFVTKGTNQSFATKALSCCLLLCHQSVRDLNMQHDGRRYASGEKSMLGKLGLVQLRWGGSSSVVEKRETNASVNLLRKISDCGVQPKTSIVCCLSKDCWEQNPKTDEYAYRKPKHMPSTLRQRYCLPNTNTHS